MSTGNHPITAKWVIDGINKAVQHAVNYHGLDAKLNMADWKIADLLTPEIVKHLEGTTTVQVIERMTPEQRATIGVTS
jgi:hypothetical protein